MIVNVRSQLVRNLVDEIYDSIPLELSNAQDVDEVLDIKNERAWKTLASNILGLIRDSTLADITEALQELERYR